MELYVGLMIKEATMTKMAYLSQGVDTVMPTTNSTELTKSMMSTSMIQTTKMKMVVQMSLMNGTDLKMAKTSSTLKPNYKILNRKKKT